MPVRRALRTLALGIDVAVFLWRRYNSAAQNPTAVRDEQQAVPLEQNGTLGARGDITGDAATAVHTQTVRFGLDGQAFEIDLSNETATELRAAFDRYITAGRRVGQRTKRAGSVPASPQVRTRPANAETSAAIRDWARTHAHQVSDRGPIPATVRNAYAARPGDGST